MQSAAAAGPGTSDGSMKAAGWRQFISWQREHDVHDFSLPSHTHTHTHVRLHLTGMCWHSRTCTWTCTRRSERHSARVRGGGAAGPGNGKASEESNHLLTARHDWKYAKYSPRNRDGYSPLARGAAQTLPSILNRRAAVFFSSSYEWN